MNAREKAQVAKFRRACKICLRPKYIGNACIKFAAQYMRITGLDVLIQSELRYKFRKYPRPKGWRKTLFLKLRKTVFKLLRNDRIEGKSLFYIFGKAVGIAKSVNYVTDKEMENDKDKKLFEEAFELPPDWRETLREESEKISLPKAKNQRATISQLEEYAEGLRDGARALFNDDSSLAHARQPTDIQISLLIFSDIVNAAPNIYTLWDFFKEHLGDDFKHSPESLEKICRRAGMSLALKSSPREKPGQNQSKVSGQ